MSYKFPIGAVVIVQQAQNNFEVDKIPERFVGRVGIVVGDSDAYPSYKHSKVLVGLDILSIHDECLRFA